MESRTEVTDWMDEEIKAAEQTSGVERLPSVKFKENTITTLRIDASKAFVKWTDQETGKVKAIIPCAVVEDSGLLTSSNFWLNLKNPIFVEIIRACRDAPDKANVLLRILATGTKQNTKYVLVK